MGNKKKLSILIGSAVTLTMLIQGNSYAVNKDTTFIARASSIARQVISLSANVASTTVEDPDEEVTITCRDINLYKKLKSEIEVDVVQYDDTNLQIKIKRSELNSITSLKLSNAQISDLTGIENFTYLTELILSKNSISDISKLSNLLRLNKLDLSGMSDKSLKDISSLTGLINLVDLNVSGNDISSIKGLETLTNLETLNLSNNSISSAKEVKGLNNLKSIDISENLSFSSLEDILTPKLEVLRAHTTSITDVENISTSSKLKEIDLHNNRIETWSPLFETIEINNKDVLILSGIEKLNLGSTTKNGMTYSKLVDMPELNYLDFSNNKMTSVSGLYDLTNLKYLNLDSNGISDIDDFIHTKKVDGVEIVDKAITATQIYLRSNKEIEDISVFYKITAFNNGNTDKTITHLYLDDNRIHQIGAIENLKGIADVSLRNQTINMGIYKNKVDENYYVILPEIMQGAKDPNSIAYNENAKFTTKSVELNSDEIYNSSPNYNVIITPDKTGSDKLSVSLSGGIASGTTINFVMTTSTSGIETIIFDDENLKIGVWDKLLEVRGDDDSYIAQIPKIINVERTVVNKVTELNLQSREIEKLRGIESFTKLKKLELQNNKISDDSKLAYLTALEELNLANNNLANSYRSIENLYSLKILDLTKNGIKDLESIDKLIENIAAKKKKVVLERLILGSNELQDEDITVLSKLTTLTNLDISGNEITDLRPIVTNENIDTLNISKNKISDILPLAQLINLKNLSMANNLVEDLNPIKDLPLNNLNIGANRISDITALENLNLTKLEMQDNKINDISAIEGKLLKDGVFVERQKLSYILKSNETGTVTIPLPEIFKSAKNSSSKVYTTQDLKTNRCTLSEDGKSVIVNVEQLNENVATVTIKDGAAEGTQFSIGEGIKAIIDYSTKTPTNKDVVATIRFSGNETDRNIRVINNEGKTTYTFTKNGEFVFEFEDDYGFSGTATAKVDWIDKEGPTATVSYSTKTITKNDVTVTITSNEECKAPTGWDLSQDKKIITKVYTNNVNEKVTLEDELGNQSKIDVIITNIDKSAPVIEGVEEGKTYTQSVRPKITDVNLDTIELTKDGVKVSGYKNNDTISENGQYKLSATDKVGNKTEVNFTIIMDEEQFNVEIKDYETSTEGNTNYVENISPKTTIASLKNSIVTNGNIEIYKGTEKITDSTTKIATGMTVKITKDTQTKEYVVVVIGDCNGNGTTNVSDLTKLMMSRAESLATNKDESKILKGAYEKAVDLNGDKKISIGDITKLCIYIAENK